jgi:hypothetical protein
MRQPTLVGDIRRQFEDAAIIDVIKHGNLTGQKDKAKPAELP